MTRARPGNARLGDQIARTPPGTLGHFFGTKRGRAEGARGFNRIGCGSCKASQNDRGQNVPIGVSACSSLSS